MYTFFRFFINFVNLCVHDTFPSNYNDFFFKPRGQSRDGINPERGTAYVPVKL
jgi:hypothetical protein